MMTNSNQEDKFDEVFDLIYNRTLDRKKKNPDFTIQELEALLNTEYNHQDMGWDSGGGVHEIVLHATISAYEAVLALWRKEIEDSKK